MMKKTTKTIPGDALLVDILSDSSFKKEHIKGAKNFSVYEVAFLDKMQDACHNKKQTICIYGWSDKTEEVDRAYNLLSKDGYVNVWTLEGGLEAWKVEGNKIEGESKGGELEGNFVISSQESVIEWSGRNIGKKHTGTISLKKGSILFEDGEPKSGELVFDMKSILNKDLDCEYGDFLVSHLQSDDFFSAEKFPEAKMQIKKVSKLVDIKSKPNFKIKAILTIKEISKEIYFDAFIHEKEKQIFLNAHFDIDRTNWNVKYGSEKFFSKLGIHIIDDMISFDLVLVAEKE